jgi:hypothetical protein
MATWFKRPIIACFPWMSRCGTQTAALLSFRHFSPGHDAIKLMDCA